MTHKTQKLQEEVAIAVVESFSHDGRGIAHVNGKTVFLAGALPGETVRFQYLRRRGSFDEGQVLSAITPSNARRTPPCPHFGICGGCSLQHLDAPTQWQHKQEAFADLLWRQAKIKPQEWLSPITGPEWGYRRKARLGVKFITRKNKLVIGFRERQGRLIADSRQCEVLVPSIGQHIEAFVALIETLSIRDKIPQLEVAVGDNASAVVIRHLAAFNADDLQAISCFAAQYQLRIYLQPAGNDSVHEFYPGGSEALYYSLPRYDLKLNFQPWQFIQINAVVNQKMIDRALALLECGPGDRVLDLFCGIGNFSLPMARLGAHVIGVEGDKEAVAQAQRNAQSNGVGGCEFYAADLFQTGLTAAWAKQSFDKILLDPPRSGAEQIIAMLPQWQPKHIVYVSCDLATLARDSLQLQQQGYTLIKAGIMDMFPHTQHAEAMTLFKSSR
jgi:23S rRNA (uracil1939-C5)-methyltransferase